MFDNIRYDIKNIMQKDPAARSAIEVFFLYPSVRALRDYRFAHWLYKHKCFFLARMVSQNSRRATNIEIHPAATIGKGLFIDHGAGVIIGETTIIGDNCTLYQGVTLGGTGKDIGKRHPTLGNNVMVGAGAKILGPFTVGDNAKIAANAVVLSEVPPDATCVGVPGRVVRVKNQRVNDMDQIHIPDPVAQQFAAMQKQIDSLIQELETMKKGEF